VLALELAATKRAFRKAQKCIRLLLRETDRDLINFRRPAEEDRPTSVYDEETELALSAMVSNPDARTGTRQRRETAH
jgi:hypothetical protein